MRVSITTRPTPRRKQVNGRTVVGSRTNRRNVSMDIAINLTEEQELIVVHTHLWRAYHSLRTEYWDLLDTSRIDAMQCEDTKERLLKMSIKRRKTIKKRIKACKILIAAIKENE